MKVIRPEKNGGYSECNSPDELVGKGRCYHVLDGTQPVMEMYKIQRGTYGVKICDSSLTIKAQKKVIIDFFNNIKKIDENEQKKIIDFLNKE